MPMKFSFFIPVKSSFLKIESESFNPSNSVSRADLSSYTGICIHPPQMGLEPTIPGLEGQCLIHQATGALAENEVDSREWFRPIVHVAKVDITLPLRFCNQHDLYKLTEAVKK